MKVAISVPDTVFDAAETLASQLKLSRSQLYSQALAAFLKSRGAASVTAQLDAVHGRVDDEIDPALAAAQFRSLPHETW